MTLLLATRLIRHLRSCLRTCLVLAAIGIVTAGDVGWQPALPGYKFEFPHDHVSHPDYKIEWWYYTGNVAATDGRRFGYQLTFFRIGVNFKPSNPSRWAVRDLFMTHLAVSDIDGAGQRFHFAERVNRAGIGWAGAATDSYHVWNDDWDGRLNPAGQHQLRAQEGDFGVDLALDPGKSPTAHGENGASQKGSQPGNATHYYSLTRMPTNGTITVNGQAIAVSGLSWMDHEFGTTLLEPEQVGWDWFAIQLDDGTDLMLFQLRRRDSNRDAHSSGSLVDGGGVKTAITVNDFSLESGSPWRSAASGATYPLAWNVTILGRGLSLKIKAALADQELRSTPPIGVTYWEGATEIEGTHDGKPVRGRGYLEMTGYTGAALGNFLH